MMQLRPGDRGRSRLRSYFKRELSWYYSAIA
jgi:hypothetical protein